MEQHSHGAGVPLQIRSERPRSASVADFEPITIRDEQWRYLPVERLMGLDADALSEYIGDLQFDGPTSITTSWIKADHPLFGAAGLPEDRTSAAAWESAEAAYLISVPAGADEKAFLTVKSTDVTPSALHIVVESKLHAKGTVVIDHRGKGVLAENIEIVVGDESDLTVISIQDWESGSVHTSAQFAKLGRNSHLKHIVVSLGGDTVRVTPSVYFDGPGASVDLYGVYFADSNQHLEHRPFVDHSQPNCTSRVTYKGALQGDKAHTVWVGDVLIRKEAEGTDTYELNRNLLLTDGARADSVPNLEIETGQIEGAGHASASGRFDDEHLFYLQARGINELEARRLVVKGFLNEIVQQIGIEELEERLNKSIEEELKRSVK
ncbi:MAG: hypothetical protein RLZZ108_598 [Actinomycetota bacterium]